jgi:hypothetical protein
MTEQSPDLSEATAAGRQHRSSQKLERLLKSLNRLKSDISEVESRHPGLGSELSSLCGTIIADLNSLNPPDRQAQQPAGNGPSVTSAEQEALPELAPTTGSAANPVFSVIDKAGTHLIKGLDKTGDGIIFILDKLFTKRVIKANPGIPPEADQ